VLWLFSQGVMALYTPLSGSWLNMAESIQRIIGRQARRLRSLQRQHALAGSGACTRRPLRRRPSALQKSLFSCQVPHWYCNHSHDVDLTRIGNAVMPSRSAT